MSGELKQVNGQILMSYTVEWFFLELLKLTSILDWRSLELVNILKQLEQWCFCPAPVQKVIQLRWRKQTIDCLFFSLYTTVMAYRLNHQPNSRLINVIFLQIESSRLMKLIILLLSGCAVAYFNIFAAYGYDLNILQSA